MKNYKFIKYQNIIDNETIVYALEKDAVIKNIDGICFIETTSDFKTTQLSRFETLKPIAFYERKFQ